MGRFFARSLVVVFVAGLLALWAHVARMEDRRADDSRVIDVDFEVVGESADPAADSLGSAPGLPQNPLAQSLPADVIIRVAEEARVRERIAIHSASPTPSSDGNRNSPWRVSHHSVELPRAIDSGSEIHSAQLAAALPLAKQFEIQSGVRMDFVNHAERGLEQFDWTPTAGLTFYF